MCLCLSLDSLNQLKQAVGIPLTMKYIGIDSAHFQAELAKTRAQVETEMVARGVDQVDAVLVKSYAKDVRSLLEETEVTERKAFLRSFIERIEVNGSEATIRYRLPLPQGGQTNDRVSVSLPSPRPFMFEESDGLSAGPSQWSEANKTVFRAACPYISRDCVTRG